MDLTKMAPDARLKLLALTMVAHEDMEIELDDSRVITLLTEAIRAYYIQFDSRLDLYSHADTLAKWQSAIDAATDKVYGEVK